MEQGQPLAIRFPYISPTLYPTAGVFKPCLIMIWEEDARSSETKQSAAKNRLSRRHQQRAGRTIPTIML